MSKRQPKDGSEGKNLSDDVSIFRFPEFRNEAEPKPMRKRQPPRIKLVRKAFAGDREATRKLVEERNRIFFPQVRARFGLGPIAHKLEDVLAEGWKRVFELRDGFDAGPGGKDFDVWAFRIICRHAEERIKNIVRLWREDDPEMPKPSMQEHDCDEPAG